MKGSKKNERLADFSQHAWHAVLSSNALTITIKVGEKLKRVADKHEAIETVSEILRMPQLIIAEAVAFEHEHAAVGRRTRNALPSFPVSAPWSQTRKASLQKEVWHAVERVCGQAVNLNLISESDAPIFRSGVFSDLMGEIERRWEEGQREHYEALQRIEGAAANARWTGRLGGSERSKKRRRTRGKTTDELLEELLSTEEGRRAILAAGTIDRIATKIGRSHGAVGGSAVWKRKIKPLVDTLRGEAKLARFEWEERRQDRLKTD